MRPNTDIRAFLWGFLICAFFVFLFNFCMTGCAGREIFPAHPLNEQLIKPRPGHEGKLTNRSCSKYEKDLCVEEHIQEYALSDKDFRETANQLDFICNIGGRRFKICLDKPGFCRVSYKENCFLFFCSRGERLEEYLPVEKYKFLLDSGARCANKQMYNLWDKP